MNAKAMLVSVAVAASSASFAADYSWVAGATDWNSASSYKDSNGNVQTVLPQSIGTLTFTSAQTLTVDDDTIGFVSGIGNLKLVEGFVLDVNVAHDARLNCTINYNNSSCVGTLRKRGVGSLQLGDRKSIYDYTVAIDHRAGVLRLPGNTTEYSAMWFGDVTVVRGAAAAREKHGPGA